MGGRVRHGRRVCGTTAPPQPATGQPRLRSGAPRLAAAAAHRWAGTPCSRWQPACAAPPCAQRSARTAAAPPSGKHPRLRQGGAAAQHAQQHASMEPLSRQAEGAEGVCSWMPTQLHACRPAARSGSSAAHPPRLSLSGWLSRLNASLTPCTEQRRSGEQPWAAGGRWAAQPATAAGSSEGRRCSPSACGQVQAHQDGVRGRHLHAIQPAGPQRPCRRRWPAGLARGGRGGQGLQRRTAARASCMHACLSGLGVQPQRQRAAPRSGRRQGTQDFHHPP